jgi:hypothetical protein
MNGQCRDEIVQWETVAPNSLCNPTSGTSRDDFHSLCRSTICKTRTFGLWITITHVCRYWRSVALGCSDLWKRLRFFNPDVTKEMTRRSKEDNMEVIIDGDFEMHQSIAKSTLIPMVLPEFLRVSVLHIRRTELLEFLVDSIVSAAPKLKYLSFISCVAYTGYDIFSGNTRFTLPRAS